MNQLLNSISIHLFFDTYKEEKICHNSAPLNDVHDDEMELQFLKVLQHDSLERKLQYVTRDLVNFHVSVKTNLLTILSGLSGTGKTQLALTYANALGLRQDKENLLIVSISPSYTEPVDMIGYLNTNNGMYIPSETGLVDFLKKAQDNPDEMFFVVFDEMNLSQIEYWFAPFISLLELDEPDRNLSLYNKTDFCRNQDKYPGTIHIGENIRFVGTLNKDETTKELSDRLLDRSNVITLEKVEFAKFLENQQNPENYIEREINSINELKSLFASSNTYLKWIKNDDFTQVFTYEELKFFDKLNDLLSEEDCDMGVSFRVIKRIANFMSNIPVGSKNKPMMSKDYAFDLQIKQRILTKVRGSEEQCEGIVGKLTNRSQELSGSKLYDFFTKYQQPELSNFTITLDEIKKKARELYVYGYTN